MGINGLTQVHSSCSPKSCIDLSLQVIKSAAERHDWLHYAVTQSFPSGSAECEPPLFGINARCVLGFNTPSLLTIFSIWLYQADRALNYGNGRGNNPQLGVLFYRLVYLLTLPIRVVIIFDGPGRPSIKRGTAVLTNGHWLTGPFQKLIDAFGYHWYTAPGEAEAELAQLNALKIVDVVVTTDVDALVFGATAMMALHALIKKDKGEITLYTSENIFITPDVSLTRGGLLLIALLVGGDYDEGLDGCGVSLAHAVARGNLGDALLSAALEQDEMTFEFTKFLHEWKLSLVTEFATDPHGYLGRKCKAIAATLEAASFPNPDVLRAYTHPTTSWSSAYSAPAYQLWGLAQPNLGRIASLCQLQFGWNAAEISSKFTTLVYPGLAVQSLLRVRFLFRLLLVSFLICLIDSRTICKHFSKRTSTPVSGLTRPCPAPLCFGS
ncbi:PIN domain-like protein [Mycena sanguinolenta]|nr:PIN domain-like protein [Mycena sanguinolenta]